METRRRKQDARRSLMALSARCRGRSPCGGSSAGAGISESPSGRICVRLDLSSCPVGSIGVIRRAWRLTMRRFVLAWCVWFALMPAAHAGELSVLGIKFDAPFDAPACSSPPGLTSVVCIVEGRSGWRDERADVYVPIEKKPAEIENPLKVGFKDGAPRTMTFRFPGISANLAVLKLLEDKFGAPIEKVVIEKQNQYGAKYQVTEAKWRTEELEVTLSVAAVNSGTVMILGPGHMRDFWSDRRSRGLVPRPAL